MKLILALALLLVTPLHAHIKRDRRVTQQFQKLHPCPSTGKRSGRCPGYVKDHIIPLRCGGSDSPSNMQWQTIAAGKAKDKVERQCKH